MSSEFPLPELLAHLARWPKLPIHTGKARFQSFGEREERSKDPLRKLALAVGQPFGEPEQHEFEAQFLVPISGACQVFLTWDANFELSNNFGSQLEIRGTYQGQDYILQSPEFYVRDHSGPSDKQKWALLCPINQPSVIEYGPQRPIKWIRAKINNLHFEKRPVAQSKQDEPVLQLLADSRPVDFFWTQDWENLFHLLKTGTVRTTSLLEFQFRPWDGSTEGDWCLFAKNISSLCNYAAGQLCGIPMVTLLDEEGLSVKRFLYQPVESKFRSDFALPVMHAPCGLPQLFAKSFANHCLMQSQVHWQRFNQLYSTIDDLTFMESRFGNLMAAVELLIRNSLLEAEQSGDCDRGFRNLPDLIRAARNQLNWDIPSHYTEGDRHRLIRNAVQHGDRLPFEVHNVWEEFAKWKLFLLRRILIRLGFDGPIVSVKSGFAAHSEVDDFGEEHNSFCG